MSKIGSKQQNIFGIFLLLIIIFTWQQGLLEKDIMPYLKILMWVIIGIVLIVGLIFLFSKIRNYNLLKTVTKSDRGTKAERDLVLKLLKHGVPAQHIFHDLYLKKNNGEFSQIDLVVLTTAGIIVIEVKDFSGWIFGDGNYSQWTKVLAFGKDRYRFYNPIMQNSMHIQELKKQLKQFENIPFYSIVVFYGDCVLKEVSFVPKGTYLVKPKRVLEVLRIITKENKLVYYNSEVVNVLKNAVLNGGNAENRKQHIENINDMLGKNRIFE